MYLNHFPKAKVIIVLILIFTMMTACSNNEEAQGGSQNTSPYEDFLTIDVFDTQANYQGIQTGWFAQIVKEKFNMELNIIAPNVSGGSTVLQTRSAAGNLGDIVMIGAENGGLSNAVKAGLLYDMTDLVDSHENISQYTEALEMSKSLVDDGHLYAIPSSVSSQPATTPSEGLDLTFGPYLRWDYYQEIGSPTIDTLEDMLPVLKEMQEAHPTSDSGQKTYGISMFSDWDSNMMTWVKQPTCFYGYDELGFVLSKADGTDDQSIIDDDSMYVRVLKFYYEANQMGLMDPESTTQNYDTLYSKTQDGAILFSPWPWLGQQAYNTTENKENGKGFMLVPIQDMQIYSYGAKPSGDKYVIGIGSKAKDPERMMDFIDWLYSPEGIMMSTSQTTGSCGPEGLTWEMKDGRPELTDFGKEALINQGATMPDEWGGGSWKDGSSTLNYSSVATIDLNPDTGFAYNYKLWDSYLEMNSTPLDTSWQEAMDATTTLDYLQQHDEYIVAPGTDFIQDEESAEISTLRTQCKSIIVENSWKMVFAKDEDEFNSLLKDMQETVKGLGYDQVLAFDLEQAAEQNAAREAARQASTD